MAEWKINSGWETTKSQFGLSLCWTSAWLLNAWKTRDEKEIVFLVCHLGTYSAHSSAAQANSGTGNDLAKSVQ